jgi:hypothetical protein
MKVKGQKMIAGNRENLANYCDFIHAPGWSKRSEKMINEFFYGS